jgi:hypothetical protein
MFFILGVNSFAQVQVDSIRRKSLQLDFGVNQLKEENIHLKVHTGMVTGFSYNHYLRSKNISDFGITIKWSRAKTAYEDLSGTANAHIIGNYRYLFKTYCQGKIIYAVGPEINIHYNLGLYPNWDESHLYWANQFSLNADNVSLSILSYLKGLYCNHLRISIPNKRTVF